MTPSNPAADASAHDQLTDIYQALKVGRGHDRVTDDNVQALIQLAARYGDTLTETLLREWRSPCGEDAAMPVLDKNALPPARAPR